MSSPARHILSIMKFLKMPGKLNRFLHGKIKHWRAQKELRRLICDTALNCAGEGETGAGLDLKNWEDSLANPNDFYRRCTGFFYHKLPKEIQEHRAWFRLNKRGFGEDAFHTMWWLIFNELRPENFLEIGVYRGQTLSLAALLHRHLGIAGGTVLGISPFSSAGDAVSTYLDSVDYYDDTRKNFAHFDLPTPELLRAYSTDMPAIQRIAAQTWDAIYIDGNHDYEIAARDWENCAEHVRDGGVLVLYDSALNTAYQPPLFASKGHPGPSRLAAEIKARGQFTEILQVGHNRVFRKNTGGDRKILH
jgi:hypothetical protein